jgi:hypothetical protein
LALNAILFCPLLPVLYYRVSRRCLYSPLRIKPLFVAA